VYTFENKKRHKTALRVIQPGEFLQRKIKGEQSNAMLCQKQNIEADRKIKKIKETRE